jgi:hypothetical protein
MGGAGVTAAVHIVVPREFRAWTRGFAVLPAEAAAVAQETFDLALDVYYGATQEVVHVITGHLKASGHVEKMASLGTSIEGAVVYDAEYAQIENDRGGTHAFMDIGWERAQSTFDAVLPAAWVTVVNSWR